MKIAIIGANNGLSNQLIRDLDKMGQYEILQVYHSNTNLLLPNHPTISIEKLFQLNHDFDCIFFFASHIKYEFTPENAEKCISTNVNLLNELSSHFTKSTIIHTSTVSIFETSSETISENSSINPKNYYSISKLFAEKMVQHHKAGGINLRVSSLFGENMKENTFLPHLVNQALQENKVRLYGSGERKQNYISYAEMSEYLIRAMQTEGKNIPTLLAVNEKSYSNIEVAEMLTKLQPDLEITFEGEDASPSYIYNNSFTKSTLHLQNNYSFEKELLNYYLWKKSLY